MKFNLHWIMQQAQCMCLFLICIHFTIWFFVCRNLCHLQNDSWYSKQGDNVKLSLQERELTLSTPLTYRKIQILKYMHVTINIHLLMHFVYIVITDIRRTGCSTYIYIFIHVGQNMPNMLFLSFQIHVRRSFVTHFKKKG